MPDYVPDTIVRVLKDVPFDLTYSDTINFQSVGEQTSFMAGKAKASYNDMTYQRVNSSVASPRGPLSVRVPDIADNLYDCNYLMFQNSNYGNKWFYAFIQKVNYINPNNTEIIYIIDYFQTFLFDFEVLPSYVEREHPSSDNKFEHLLPEPFGEPDMYCQSITPIDLQTGPASIVVGVSTDTAGQTVAGETYFGVYSGVELHQFSSASAATSFIRQYDDLGKSAAIVCVYMSPWNIDINPQQQINFHNAPSNLNGYVPRNNKLLSYPYCKLTLSNRQGENIDFYYEYFGTPKSTGGMTAGTPEFHAVAIGGLNPMGVCRARNYNGQDVDYDHVSTVRNFPQCAWTSDAFANWLAGEGTADAFRVLSNAAIGGLSSIATGAIGALTGNPIALMSSVSSGVSTIGTLAGGMIDTGLESSVRQKCPGLTKGTTSPTQINLAEGVVGFDVKQMAINPEAAAAIDGFFDMFGYATNKLKVPEMTGRESWNYVKCNNVIIKGSVPAEGMVIIKNAFNRGIRLWHGDFVGNYARSNRPITEVGRN